jgi:membrane-associated protease RseP (regulator of RpoE activity)
MSEPYDLSHYFDYESVAVKPTTGTWLKHIIFLAITLCTATIAGVLLPFGQGIDFPPLDLAVWNDTALFVSWIPTLYSLFVVDVIYHLLADPEMLVRGLSFSVPLLFILTCHEMGHYVACRLYGVDSSLPYFIPTPPMIGPAGTFGAFIRIRSRIPTRRAIFDIGVAGPITGFIALIPVAIIAAATMTPVPAPDPVPEGMIALSDPLLIKGMTFLFGTNAEWINLNPFYAAAWMGALVTALNLIPSGQLDGGHAMFAALGERVHAWTGKIAFVVMAVLSILGMLIYQSPSGFLIAILLGVMMRIPHPPPWDNTPLDAKRKVIAVVTLLIFILCFVPFPIRIT